MAANEQDEEIRHSSLGQTVGSSIPVSMQPPTASSSTDDIAAYCEAVCLSHTSAIQQRDFSPTSTFWMYKASSWRAEVSLFSDLTFGMLDYFETWKSIARTYPEYSIRILDLTTFVNRDAGAAEVYANTETMGIPPGLTRHGTGIASFRLIQGEWLATVYKTVHASM